MDSFGADMDLMQPLPSSQQWAKTQLEVIQRMILAYQKSLDTEHDVALLLTHFGESITLEIEAIMAVSPVMLAFRGKVSGKTSILFQHVSQINFLLTSVRIPPQVPHRTIGFNSRWD